MHMGKALMAAYLMTLTSMANATDWEHILDSSEGRVFVDLDSYGDDAVYSTITTKTEYATALKTLSKPPKPYTAKLVTAQYDCNQHSIKILSIVLLDQHARVVDRQTPAARMIPLVGNKADTDVEALVCQVRKMVRG